MYEIGSDKWPGMAKMIEEMGELAQVMAKIMSCHGGTDYWDGSNLKERLREELADLEAATWFFRVMNQEALNMDDREIREAYQRRYRRKQDAFLAWHEDQQSLLQGGTPLPVTVHPSELG